MKRFHVSKNLFDKDNATIYYAYLTSVQWITSTDSRSVKIPCQPNTQYTLSVGETLQVFRIAESDNVDIVPTASISPITVSYSNLSEYTFTTAADTACIIFQGSAGLVNTWIASLMLNKGSTALPYEPFETDNLFNPNGSKTVLNQFIYQYTITGLTPNAQYTCSSNFVADRTKGASIYFNGTSTTTSGVSEGYNVISTADSNGEVYILIRHEAQVDTNPAVYDDLINGTIWVMLNEGSTALPYTPYGSTWQTKSPQNYGTGTDTVTNLPVKLYTDGQPITTWSIDANTETSGTPSPSSPITINGVGNKTANLFNKNNLTYGFINTNGAVISHNDYVVSDYIPLDNGVSFSATFAGSVVVIYAIYDSNHNYVSDSRTVKTNASFSIPAQSGVYVLINFSSAIADLATAMINDGTTPLPYEPVGYKLSILSNGTALTPIYLSNQLMKIGTYIDNVVSSGTATYNVKKLVLTGQEDFVESGSSNAPFILPLSNNGKYDGTNAVTWTCSHYSAVPNSATWTEYDTMLSVSQSDLTQATTEYYRIRFRDTSCADLAAFKAFLAAQYAANTPVTIYYVLATAETETVTAPAIPTTGGEVSIDVDTTVKPSEMSLTYHGWHTDQPKRKSANLFDKSTIVTNTYVTINGESASNYFYCSDYIPISQGAYYFTNVAGSSYQYCGVTYDSAKNPLRNLEINSSSPATSGSISMNANEHYLRINMRYTTDVDTVMVNEGSTALPYAPYWE